MQDYSQFKQVKNAYEWNIRHLHTVDMSRAQDLQDVMIQDLYNTTLMLFTFIKQSRLTYILSLMTNWFYRMKLVCPYESTFDDQKLSVNLVEHFTISITAEIEATEIRKDPLKHSTTKLFTSWIEKFRSYEVNTFKRACGANGLAVFLQDDFKMVLLKSVVFHTAELFGVAQSQT